MKKVRNKEWRDRHARIKHQHELKRREKNRYIIVYEPQPSYEPFGSTGYFQKQKIQKRLQRKIASHSFETLEAPRNFSIHSNPDESLTFFSQIEIGITYGSPIYFNMKKIEKLSIDAIMYFLALLKRVKLSKMPCGIKGSVPDDIKCKELLKASGFFKYVGSGIMKQDLNYTSEVVQIETGEKVDPEVAKKICDFAMSKLNLERIDINELYDIIIELMSNTRQHAYLNKRFPNNDWYIFVKFIAEKKAVRFIFLDTGEGIPSTVRRKGLELAKGFIGFGTNHTEYIKSALEGQFRTRTGELYRGKGLPRIYSYNKQEYINGLTIISNCGYFAEKQNGDMERELKGSLFYWELSKEP